MNERNVKSLLAFIIVLVAFSILLIFTSNEAALTAPATFPVFFTLATVCLGLLAGLLFLVSKPHAAKTAKVAKPAKKASHKKKR